ncbi:MAG: type II toxin-antitoxin system RelE/ParE family toxin [Candidatus Binatia bacterium]
MPKKQRFKVLWTFAASQDIESIIDFIARNSPQAAGRVLRNLRNRVETLKIFPERGRLVPELADIGLQLYRELLITPWRIVYRLSNNTVYVMMVIDGRRNAEDLLLERLVRQV